jgi:hypothetical protein
MYYIWKYLLITITLLLTANQLYLAEDSDQKVIVVTDNIPPYTYQNSEGKFVGIIAEKVHSLFNKAGISYEIKRIPWKRTIVKSYPDSNLMIYPLSRIPERESNFQWIMPLYSESLNIYGLAEKYSNKKIDITSGDYRFICVEKTSLCSALRTMNVPEHAITKITQVATTQLLKMVVRERIDFLIMAKAEIELSQKELGLSSDFFVTLDGYQYDVVEYLAAKPGINSQIIARMRMTAEKMLYNED